MKKTISILLLGTTLITSAAYAATSGNTFTNRMEKHKACRQVALSKLPAEKAKKISELLDKTFAANKGKFDQIKTLKSANKELFLAKDFDKAAYLSNSKQLGNVFSQLQQSRTETTAEIASLLTAEERQLYRNGMRDCYGHHKGGKKK